MLAKCYVMTMATMALLFSLVSVGTAQTSPPAWSATATYSIGDQAQMNGNIYRAIKAVGTAGLKPTVAYRYWELYYVRANTTLVIGVGQTFPDLVSAWNYGLNATIAGSAALTLYISTAKGNFNETFTGGFALDHAFGARITIEADHADNTNLTFTNTSGFYLDSGHAIGFIGDLQLTSASTGGYTAFYLSGNASIFETFGMIFNNFYAAVYVEKGAQINCANTLLFDGVHYPFIADSNASISISGGFSFSNDTLNSNPQMYAAFYAEDGGRIFAENCTVYNAKYEIAYATSGGTIDVSGGTLALAPIGLVAVSGGRIEAEYSTISQCANDDLDADHGGTINAAGATYTTTLLEPTTALTFGTKFVRRGVLFGHFLPDRKEPESLTHAPPGKWL